MLEMSQLLLFRGVYALILMASFILCIALYKKGYVWFIFFVLLLTIVLTETYLYYKKKRQFLEMRSVFLEDEAESTLL